MEANHIENPAALTIVWNIPRQKHISANQKQMINGIRWAVLCTVNEIHKVLEMVQLQRSICTEVPQLIHNIAARSETEGKLIQRKSKAGSCFYVIVGGFLWLKDEPTSRIGGWGTTSAGACGLG
jgi:hypothetical protein